jgi:hypothetical protein
MRIQFRSLALGGLSATVLLSAPLPCRSDLLVVPDQYPTTQSAFDAAARGDSIMVRAGTYLEALVIFSKDVTLFGESGAVATIITTNSTARVFDITAGVGPLTVLSDLTIRDGLADDGGGIMVKEGASLTLRRSRLLSNVSFREEESSWGGAILAGNGSSLIVEDCHFEGNVADCFNLWAAGYGGAISAWAGSDIRVARTTFVSNGAAGFEGGYGGAIHVGPGASATIEDCWFRDNVANGGGVGSEGDVTIAGSVFTGHFGYGGAAVACSGQSTIRHNLFFDNHNWGESGVVSIIQPDGPSELRNNTVVFNTGGGVYVEQVMVENNIIAGNTESGLSCYNATGILCNDVFDNSPNYAGGCPDLTGIDGNISLDPRFCDTGARDLHLHIDSPCAPGASDCQLIGALDVGCTVSGVSEASPLRAPRLLPMRPNPISLPAVLAFDLPAPANVQLRIYDAMGRGATTLAEGPFATGRHEIVWQGRTVNGQDLASGVYFLTFQASAVRQTQRLVLIR